LHAFWSVSLLLFKVPECTALLFFSHLFNLERIKIKRSPNTNPPVPPKVVHAPKRVIPKVATTTTTTRPRPPALWNVQDVVLWFERHCGVLGVEYSDLFLQNNISGRTLLRMNSSALERMGISNQAHLQEIWREIIKLKLKSDILELRDIEMQIDSSSS
jgi:hypothetical protein